MVTLLAHCSLLTLAPGGRARASQLGVAHPNTIPVSQALGLRLQPETQLFWLTQPRPLLPQPLWLSQGPCRLSPLGSCPIV